jgi:integrase
MPSFRKPKAQAERAVQQMLGIGSARHTNRHDGKIHSLGTKRNYTQALTRVTEWIQKNKVGDLRSFNREKAIRYLKERSENIGQKTLNQERQAIQKYLKLTLPAIKSELTQIQKSRSYTQQQIHLIIQAQTPRNQLATQIASAAGLRAHELLTLRRKKEQAASTHRTWSSDRFTGRSGEIYTVIGKGGLIREVLIPSSLATELESKKLATPKVIKDRDIRYTQYYDINGGKNWSNSFSNASQRALQRSNGAHGLRHSYAQDRMEELQSRGFIYETALGIVSQEMGHFRPHITEAAYLR